MFILTLYDGLTDPQQLFMSAIASIKVNTIHCFVNHITKHSTKRLYHSIQI